MKPYLMKTVFGLALLALPPAVAGTDWGGRPRYEGEATPLLKEEPHMRRLYDVYRQVLQGGLRTEDTGVYDPYRKGPQYDPRIPY